MDKFIKKNLNLQAKEVEFMKRRLFCLWKCTRSPWAISKLPFASLDVCLRA